MLKGGRGNQYVSIRREGEGANIWGRRENQSKLRERNAWVRCVQLNSAYFICHILSNVISSSMSLLIFPLHGAKEREREWEDMGERERDRYRNILRKDKKNKKIACHDDVKSTSLFALLFCSLFLYLFYISFSLYLFLSLSLYIFIQFPVYSISIVRTS